MEDKVEAAFLLAGAEVTHSDPYPGWAPNMKSPILKETVESYVKLFGTEPEVKAIHAGLECGLFYEKLEGLDCVSLGPDMKDIHTSEERLDIASTQRVWEYLVKVLAELKD